MKWLLCLSALLTLNAAPTVAQNALPETTKIALVCCVDHEQRQQSWEAVRRYGSDLTVYAGNLIDVNASGHDDMHEAYTVLDRSRGLRLVRQNSLALPIWGANDYAIDGNYGRNQQQRYETRQRFIDYWNEAYNSERYYRYDGLYGVYWLEHEQGRVQIIVLDTRWNRESLERKNPIAAWFREIWSQQGPWEADANADNLGERQWQWLEQQLQEPADVRVVVSSEQMLAENNGFDNWQLFGESVTRLQALLEQYNRGEIILVGGNTHYGEFARLDGSEQTVWQVTPGSINQTSSFIPSNSYRHLEAFPESSFATIEVFWRRAPIQVQLAIRDDNGRTLGEQTIAVRSARTSN